MVEFGYEPYTSQYAQYPVSKLGMTNTGGMDYKVKSMLVSPIASQLDAMFKNLC